MSDKPLPSWVRYNLSDIREWLDENGGEFDYSIRLPNQKKCGKILSECDKAAA